MAQMFEGRALRPASAARSLDAQGRTAPKIRSDRLVRERNRNTQRGITNTGNVSSFTGADPESFPEI
jgi:hypothetical protein